MFNLIIVSLTVAMVTAQTPPVWRNPWAAELAKNSEKPVKAPKTVPSGAAAALQQLLTTTPKTVQPATLPTIENLLCPLLPTLPGCPDAPAPATIPPVLAAPTPTPAAILPPPAPPVNPFCALFPALPDCPAKALAQDAPQVGVPVENLVAQTRRPLDEYAQYEYIDEPVTTQAAPVVPLTLPSLQQAFDDLLAKLNPAQAQPKLPSARS